MCGIVGYVGKRPVVDVLLKGLKQLEYRGYDSAGVAFLRGGKLEIKKSEGKLENVEKLLNGIAATYKDSLVGMGHTRWATHGKPTTENAHPHRAGHVVIVHNGIIENYQDFRKEIIARGHSPKSETDSELFAFLVYEDMEHGTKLAEAVRKNFLRIRGASSVVVMSEKEPGIIVGVRNGSPLVVATDPEGGAILASDAQPLIEYNRDVVFLNHGDMVVGTEKGLQFFDVNTGAPIQRATTRLDWSPEKLDKRGYAHYMLKEIYEQPVAFIDTMNGIVDRTQSLPFAMVPQPGVTLLEKATEITLVACGSAWHASLLGKYWLEKWAQIPVNVELASEFRYREPILRPGALVIGVSQSGETADTLAVIAEMRKQKISTLAITNTRGSSISREAEATFYTSAGPEIGVAATKTFLTQMLTLLICAGHIGAMRGGKLEQMLSSVFDELIRLPHLLEEYLDPSGLMNQEVRNAAKGLSKVKGFFFMGRGYSFPMALEAALKLKEIAYVHAEGYAAGELKHGPIAMIDHEMVVVVLAPSDTWRDKTVSNLQEVKARSAIILGIGNADDQSLKGVCDHWIALPPSKLSEPLLPFALAPVVQLLSYEIALLRGTDIDKPRNLAKSVTVE